MTSRKNDNDLPENISPFFVENVDLGLDWRIGRDSSAIKLLPREAIRKTAFVEGCSILFVDDEKPILANFVMLFGRQFEVHVADGIDAAKEMMTRLPHIDVVVSDLRMPGGSGLELLSWVRDRHPGTARILLTGYADLKTAMESVNEVRVFKLLTKPCPPKELGSAIADACSSLNASP